jgi:pyrimidine-nucleoside phosphorylase
MEVTYALGVEMLLVGGLETDRAAARERLEKSVRSGRALETFARIIEAQGGNPAVVEDPGLLPQANAVEVYSVHEGGLVARVEPRPLGEAIVAMGGGRRVVTDAVDPSVGLVVTVKPGDRVERGQPIASVFARDAEGIALGMDALRRAIVLGEQADPLPLLSHRITSRGVETL